MNDEATEIYRSEYKPLGFVFTITRYDDGLLDSSLMQTNRDWRIGGRDDLTARADETDGLAEWFMGCADVLTAIRRMATA